MLQRDTLTKDLADNKESLIPGELGNQTKILEKKESEF